MTDKPASLDLDAITARANAATPGPWGAYTFGGDTLIEIAADLEDTGTGYRARRTVCRLEDEPLDNDPAHQDWTAEEDWAQVQADAEFIAHAPTDMAALLAEIRRLKGQRKYLITQLAKRDAETGNADRALREFLGGETGPTVQPTGYLVSCLPEGHDDRWTYTVQVQHAGRGLFAVRHGIRHYGTDGTWSYEPSFDENDDTAELEWAAAHRFDHDTALRLARELAPQLTYRGRTVADALADTDPICGDENDGDWCELEPGHDGHHRADTAEWAREPTATPAP